MGYRWLGLTVIAALAFFPFVEPASAASAAAFAVQAESSLEQGAERVDRQVLHRHRAQSFYCYPRNYWWFYRPYTTAVEGYARCMPYFHYLPGRGAKSQP